MVGFFLDRHCFPIRLLVLRMWLLVERTGAFFIFAVVLTELRLIKKQLEIQNHNNNLLRGFGSRHAILVVQFSEITSAGVMPKVSDGGEPSIGARFRVR